ncbi:MAG: glycosyltransferase family 4 protein [Kiritimatiellota bacterium]|nr:glycosyltransferase family 4 protein [Kiritimatiellota bacterium]
MMAEIHKRIAIQQRVLPSYRLPFFDALAAECDTGLSVFAGEPRRSEGLDYGARPATAKFYPGKNIHLFDGMAYLCWQVGIMNWLREWQPDVLIMEANPRYLRSGAALNWMKARGGKVIGWGLGSPRPSGLFLQLRMDLRKRFVRSFDALVTYSQQGAEEYAALGFPPDLVFCAPNAVAPKPVQPLPERPSKFRNDRPGVVFVGRLQARKRVDTLLRACAMLPAEMQPALAIVGDGPERGRLEALAKAVYPGARFSGAQHGSDLEKIYREADLFVLPGTGGLAVQQAMSFGLPVIVGESDGTQSDLVRDENGWTLTEASVEGLSRLMRDALGNLPRLRSMGAASYRIVSQEVNLENMVDAFARAIHKVTES